MPLKTIRRNLLTAFQGTAIAQVIGIIVLPLFSRIYDDEAFGLLQVYSTITAFVLVMASWRYEFAVLSAATDEEVIDVVRLSVVLSLLMTFVSFAACGLAVWCEWDQRLKIGSIIWFIPPTFLLGGVFQLGGFLALRYREYRLQASTKVAQAVANAFVGLSLGLWSSASANLVIADLAGRAAGTLALLGLIRRQPQVVDLRALTLRSIRGVVTKYHDYALISLPGSLLNTAAFMLTPVLILATFDAGNAGQYGLVQRGVAFPIALISQAVAQVFSAEFAKSIRDNPHQSHDFFRRMVWVQLRLAIVPTLLLMWLGPWIFPVVFGAAWEQAGYICRVTSPLFLTSFVVGPVNMSLVIMRRLKAQAILDGFKFVAVVLLWTYIAQSKMDIISALKAHVVLSLLYYAAYLALTDMYLKADHGKREPDQPMPGNRTWDQSQNPG